MKRKLKAILLDLDGTVYYGSRLIKGADQAVEYFRDHGIRVLFLTNNSTKTRKQIQEKLTITPLPHRPTHRNRGRTAGTRHRRTLIRRRSRCGRFI